VAGGFGQPKVLVEGLVGGHGISASEFLFRSGLSSSTYRLRYLCNISTGSQSPVCLSSLQYLSMFSPRTEFYLY
jgi:hypothetical protein